MARKARPVKEGFLKSLQYLKSLPSYFLGSMHQTLATFDKPIAFKPVPPCPVLLVPGAFCTASVMNRLGEQLEALGKSVAVAPSFPYYFSAVANLCRLDTALGQYKAWLEKLKEQGIEQADVVAHSNGGLIALMALASQDGSSKKMPVIRRVVTMATPFGGFPAAPLLAPLVPCCRDLLNDATALRLARGLSDRVMRFLVSGNDSLIPPDRQFVDVSRRTVMPGFQHMDFIVGSEEKVKRTAHEVVRWLDSDS